MRQKRSNQWIRRHSPILLREKKSNLTQVGAGSAWFDRVLPAFTQTGVMFGLLSGLILSFKWLFVINYASSIGAPWATEVLMEARPPFYLMLFLMATVTGFIISLSAYEGQRQVGVAGSAIALGVAVVGGGFLKYSVFLKGSHPYLSALNLGGAAFSGFAVGVLVTKLGKYMLAGERIELNRLLDKGLVLFMVCVAVVFEGANSRATIDMDAVVSELPLAMLAEPPPLSGWRMVAAGKELTLLVSLDVESRRHFFRVVSTKDLSYVRSAHSPASREQ